MLDAVIDYLAPTWGLRRKVARMKHALALRHFEGAAGGRRTAGWRFTSTDANAASEGQLARLRDIARDLVRNNPYADGALDTIANHVVGWGITAKPKTANARVAAAWNDWTESTECDADGRLNFAGLQKLVVRSVVRDGECLVRRRLRLPEDELTIPLQIQVLEADYLDATKTNIAPLPNGGRIISGVEFDAIGRRVAYWLYPEHPGSTIPGNAQASRRIPAEGIAHVFRSDRSGQARGVSWYASVLLTMKDFDELADAALMKQKIAALLAGVITDGSGIGASGPIVGLQDAGMTFPDLEPGAMIQTPPGTDVKFTAPPSVAEYKDFSTVILHAIATGLGVTYEDLTGDYSGYNFSSARMSRLAHYDNVHDWRWMMLIPQFCDPVWSWAMTAASVMGKVPLDYPAPRWTPPPVPMIEPDKEGLAYSRNIRSGLITQSEAIRERGYEPAEVFAEMAADNATMDKLGLVLDSDARKTSQAGLTQARPMGTVVPPTDVLEEIPEPTPPRPPAGAPPGEGEGDDDQGEDDQGDDGLTEKQRAVLAALVAYRKDAREAPTLREVARKLGVDPKTLSGHIQALYRKGKLRSPTVSGAPTI